MIFGRLSDAPLYRGIHPRLDRALELLTPDFLAAVGTETQKLEGDDLFVITDEGVLIRFSSDTVRPMSRYASGVRVIAVGEGSRVVSVASFGKLEDEAPAQGPAEEPEE